MNTRRQRSKVRFAKLYPTFDVLEKRESPTDMTSAVSQAVMAGGFGSLLGDSRSQPAGRSSFAVEDYSFPLPARDHHADLGRNAREVTVASAPPRHTPEAE